jgi:membrane protein implicated in regulation of membrane protease activity
LILVGVVTVLVYFFFSIEHKGPIQIAARIGIYFLMINFGAGFGYTVMARMSLLIGRFDDLILFASRDYAYASVILLVLMTLGLILWERGRRRAETPSEQVHSS